MLLVMVVALEAEAETTVWLRVSELLAYCESPPYVAVITLEPVVLKTALQVPLPPESVIVQLVLAPVMDTAPVGVVPAPLTVTLTVTA
jgi:hypothetical protein